MRAGRWECLVSSNRSDRHRGSKAGNEARFPPTGRQTEKPELFLKFPDLEGGHHLCGDGEGPQALGEFFRWEVVGRGFPLAPRVAGRWGGGVRLGYRLACPRPGGRLVPLQPPV